MNLSKEPSTKVIIATLLFFVVSLSFTYSKSKHDAEKLHAELEAKEAAEAATKTAAQEMIVDDTPFRQSTPELIAHGQELFVQNCASCHGTSGRGDGIAGKMLSPPPRNFTSGEWTKGGAPSQIFMTITEGSPGTAMAPSGTLPTKDRWGLAHFGPTFDTKAPKETPQTLAASGLDKLPKGPKEMLPIEFALELLVEKGS